MGIKDDGVHVSKSVRQSSSYNINNLSGLYIGEVVENKDSLYTGRIKVRISDFGSKDTDRICLLAIPMGGHTQIKESGDDETKKHKSGYGFPNQKLVQTY